jgi:competence protein comEA helix-hairpin-helix repeat region
MFKSRLSLLKQGKIFLLLLMIMLLGFLFLENQERERKVIYRGKAGEAKEEFLAEGKYESLEEKWSTKEQESKDTQNSRKVSSGSESGEKAISVGASEKEKNSIGDFGKSEDVLVSAGESSPESVLSSAGESNPERQAKGEAEDKKQGKKININTATEEELESLKGIGPATAKNIISYREEYGGFSSIEEIKNVKRIGDKIFEKIKGDICV